MAKASQFLKLVDKKGLPVLGECIDSDHLDEIDLSGWSWSVSDPAALPKKDADKPGKVDPKVQQAQAKAEGQADARIAPAWLHISKRTDRATVRLMSAMDTGEVFPRATLVIEEEFEESPSPFYMEVNLTDAFVVKFDMNIDAGTAGADFKESWELNYRTIKFSYRMRGTGQQGMTDLEFDRPPDAGATISKKPPQTAAELAAQKKKDADELLKLQNKKAGK